MKVPSALFGLAALLATPALADSRSDWSGYDWKVVPRLACPDLGSTSPCPFFSAKWDWKRSQWVRLDLSWTSGTAGLRATFDNQDRADDDHVCVVVLLQDAAKANVAALFFNEHSDPRTVSEAEASTPLSPAAAARVAALVVGTKQCRDGADQDRALYQRVRAALP